MALIGQSARASYDESKRKMAEMLYGQAAELPVTSHAGGIAKALTMALHGKAIGDQNKLKQSDERRDAAAMARILNPEILPWTGEDKYGAMSRTAGYEAQNNPRLANMAFQLGISNAEKEPEREQKKGLQDYLKSFMPSGGTQQASVNTPGGPMLASPAAPAAGTAPDMSDPLNQPPKQFAPAPTQAPTQQGAPDPRVLAAFSKDPAQGFIDAEKLRIQQQEADPAFVTSKSANESYGKKSGEDYNAFMQSSMNASNNIAMLDQLDALGDGADTGKFAEIGLEGQKIAQALGMKVDDIKMGAREAMSSLGSQLTLKLRTAGGENQMPGPMSDSDRAFLQKIPPGLETSPQGRKMIIAWNKKVEQRNSEIGAILEQQAEANGGAVPANWRKIAREYNKAHPLFTQEDFDAAKQLAGKAGSQVAAGNRPAFDSFFKD